MSPVYFLAALGKAYKAMRRTAPLMDALSFHPYPNVNTQGPTVGYPWPNVGVPNLDRLKQAFYDAFAGTGQPVIGVNSTVRATSEVLPPVTIAIDELGWQVPTDGLEGYGEAENVPPVTEADQAAWYSDVVARYACDASVETVNFFHLRDESDRRRFQSGLLRTDGSPRSAYDAVKAAIAANKTCLGTPVSWRPAKTVVGAKVEWPSVRKLPKLLSSFRFRLSAEEKATFTAFLVQTQAATAAKTKRLSGAAKPVATRTGELRAYAEGGSGTFGITVAPAAGGPSGGTGARGRAPRPPRIRPAGRCPRRTRRAGGRPSGRGPRP